MVYLEAVVTLLPPIVGGRAMSILSEDDQYRPHLVVSGDNEPLPVVLAGPAALDPGETAVAQFRCIASGAGYDKLHDGVQFTIMEGARIVGIGRVIRMWNELA